MLIEYFTSAYFVAHPPAWLPWQTAFGPTPSSLPFASAMWVSAWIFQFIGHFVFEGRAPALTENLTQGE